MENATTQLSAYVDVLPVGAIILWYHPNNSSLLPKGWEICDGGSFTYLGQQYQKPNLIDKFVRGTNVYDQAPAGKKPNEGGGRVEVKLEEKNIPPHTHPVHLYTQKNGEKAKDLEKLPAVTLPTDLQFMSGGTYTNFTNKDSGISVYDAAGDTSRHPIKDLVEPVNKALETLSDLKAVANKNDSSNDAVSILPPFVYLCYLIKVS